MNKKTIAIIGSLTVVLGVFCPLFTVPIIGSVSYAGQMQGEGLLLAACAIASLLFALNNVHAPSFITGLLVLCDIALTLSNFFSKIGAMAVDDNVFSRAAAKMVSPSFGFAILLIGAGLLIASVFVKGEKIYAWDRTQIYSHKIMRRSTQILEVLQQIRACLSYPAGPTLPFQPKSSDAALVDKLGSLVKKEFRPQCKSGLGWQGLGERLRP